ncbi:MAG: Maf-like protein [Cellvibrionaceae bacterium]|nr:Maf-like protein [Cellvibrionaceae bacterium]
MHQQPLLLASQSPRRAELLRQIGVVFEPIRVDVEERRAADEQPEQYVARLARQKSAAGAQLQPGRVSLGADTIVLCGQRVLEKPIDREDCLAMLALLSGKRHQVITAVAVTHEQRQRHLTCVSQVSFREISQQEASDYWYSGEPADKAGAYAIQGLGGVFVQQIEGSYSAIVGLPLYETQALLAEFGLQCWQSNGATGPELAR